MMAFKAEIAYCVIYLFAAICIWSIQF